MQTHSINNIIASFWKCFVGALNALWHNAQKRLHHFFDETQSFPIS
jgi:hypothetical protein